MKWRKPLEILQKIRITHYMNTDLEIIATIHYHIILPYHNSLMNL